MQIQCAFHPDKEPVVACVSCGKLLCMDCRNSIAGKYYCSPCSDRLLNRSQPITNEKKLKYDSIPQTNVNDDLLALVKRMPNLSLMGYLGSVPFSKMIEKDWLGKPTIKFENYLLVSNYLYEIGAIIGKLYLGKLPILWQMFDVESGKEDESIQYFQDEARKRIDRYGKEPDSFFIFFWTTELSKIGLNLEFSPNVTKALGEKMPVQEAEPLVKMWGTEGIGFGSKYPDLTARILKNTYDSDTSQTRAEMRKHGVNIAAESQITSAEKEKEVQNQLRSYVNAYFPNLLIKLFD